MFAVVIILCLPVMLGGHLAVTAAEPNHDGELWSFQKPGDIVLHAVFPLRDALSPPRTNAEKYYFGFNFEGIAWMDAMIRRISEINRERSLPGNVTLGYNIRDSSNDPRYGRRQTLSILCKIINKGARDARAPFHFPAVIGPASDRVQSGSDKLYEIFNVPRIFYTPTSSRFDSRKMIRTVPSDLVHVEVLLQLLEDMKWKEVSVVVASRSEMWMKRANAFQNNMEKRKITLKNVIYVDTVSESSPLLHVRSQVVVVFAEANTTRIVIERVVKKQDRTWISVGQFDDPLLAIFDGFGRPSSKIIIRNSKRDKSRDDRGYFSKRLTLEENNNGNFNESVEWLHKVKKKYMQQCRGENGRKGCSKKAFQDRIMSFFTHRNDDHRSSLTLQGVEDAVNVIASSLKEVLRNCTKRLGHGDALRSCLRFSKKNYWFDSLSKANLRNKAKVFGLNQHRTLIGRYSIQLLRRITTAENKTYEKVREWSITDDLRPVRNAKVNVNDCNTSIVEDGDKNSSTGVESDGLCTRCDGTTMAIPNCKSDATVIDWTHDLAIALYSLEIITLLAVILSFLYFLKHRYSPIMILCYSWPDNIVLAVLVLFCLLPTVHIGELSSQRCSALWPTVNLIFGFYSALLLTKTLFVQNLLKCEVATERPGRRVAFSVFVTILMLVLLVTLPVFGFPPVLRYSCPPRGLVVLCDIRGNVGVIASMAFNWLLLLALCVFASVETARQRRNFCRTENLLGVAAAGLVSYTCLIISAYVNLELKHYLAVTFIRCVIYLVNPCICLIFIYLPTLRLVSTWLRQHIRQKRNLTSIKRAQVMSSKRQSAGPLNSLFGTGFSTEQSLLPLEQSGYYFDLRPASEMSYPNSLVHGVHQPARVAYGRNRAISSSHDCLSFRSEPSTDGLETLNRTESVTSFYDNLSTVIPAEEVTIGLSPEELLREISTYWESSEKTSSAFCDENQNEDVALAVEETNEWPSLEGLRASDL